MLGPPRFILALTVAMTPAISALAAENGDDSKSPLTITADPTEASPQLADVNRGDFTVTVEVKNNGKKDVLVWPYLSLKVLDSQGKPVAKTRNIGRWGFVRSSALEEIPFAELKAGKSRKIEVDLSKYEHDPDLLSSWRLPEGGDYRLVLQYKFDRAEAKEKYGAGCPNIDDPSQPWNQAIEADQTIKVKLAVRR